MINSTLTLEHVEISYHNTSIIKDCSFTLPKGRILSLLGASGCGKSTLLKAIAGLLPLSSGKISLGDKVIASSNYNLAPEHRGIGMIFQDYALFPHLSVADNVKFGLHKLSKAEQASKSQEVLALVKLSDYANRLPHELSGGQQQRVAIARALVCEPKVLLFDEPFSNLDVGIRHLLMHEIKQLLKSRQISAIFVTHDKTEAFSMADDIAILDGGEIIQFGEPQTLYDFPANRYIAELLGHGVILPATKKANVWETEIGHIPVSDASLVTIWHDDKNTDSADIFLRPHQLNCFDEQAASARIIGRAFYGDYYSYAIQLTNRTIQVTTAKRFTVGQSVNVRIVLDRTALLDRTGLASPQ